MSTKLNQTVGARVKAARSAAGLTQEQLAERVDRTKEAISNIERGHNLPTIETLDRICDALDVSIRYMFGDSAGTQRRIEALARMDLRLNEVRDDRVVAMIADVVELIVRGSKPT